jgi:1-acyl-sn-glycerol-3-phosphate acyltransferase
MRSPTPEQLETLEPFEKKAFLFADTVNRNPRLKRAAQSFLSSIGKTWVHVCTKNILHVRGLEHVRSLDPDRGVMIAANHRSFFDAYVISSVMLRNCSWIERMYFPVKGEFFYEKPVGVFVNGIMSAWAMYPPVMRRPKARAFNEYVVDLTTDLLAHRGTLVGFHPEGTRNKSDDPYTMLPAQIGTGQIVHASKPIVVPAFVLGLGNDLAKQVRGNFDGTGEPITIVFGAPLDLSAFYAAEGRLRTYKRLADHLRDVLGKLGAEERAWRREMGWPDLGPKTSVSAAPKSELEAD